LDRLGIERARELAIHVVQNIFHGAFREAAKADFPSSRHPRAVSQSELGIWISLL